MSIITKLKTEEGRDELLDAIEEKIASLALGLFFIIPTVLIVLFSLPKK